MEDTIENDNEIVTKYHEECSKGFTPNMPHTNVQLDHVGSIIVDKNKQTWAQISA